MIKKLSLVAASIVHYILATLLASVSLISFSKINDAVKLVTRFWPRSTPSPQLLVTCHFPCVLATHRETRVWLSPGASILPGLLEASRSFSAARNPCPVVHGITSALPAGVTLGKTPSVGSGV